jgi:hypothetical protein
MGNVCFEGENWVDNFQFEWEHKKNNSNFQQHTLERKEENLKSWMRFKFKQKKLKEKQFHSSILKSNYASCYVNVYSI